MANFDIFAGMAQEATLENIMLALVRLIDNVGVMSPDLVGRLRVVLDTGSSISTITTVQGVTTVSTVQSVTNLAQIGGVPATMAMQGLNLGNEGDLRRNIVFS